MESLNPLGVEPRNFCASQKMRGIRQPTSNEPQPPDSKPGDVVVGDLNSDSSLSTTLSSENTGKAIEKTDSDTEEEKEELRSFASLSHGSISVIGRRRVMEDAVAVEKFDSRHFFAVYDGHGGSGVANACRDRLHVLLAKEVKGSTRRRGSVVDWEKVMSSCFLKMDEEVGGSGGAMSNTVGSTAVVVIVGKGEIVVANCGDSRVVLCRGGAAVPLSHDHKVTNLFPFSSSFTEANVLLFQEMIFAVLLFVLKGIEVDKRSVNVLSLLLCWFSWLRWHHKASSICIPLLSRIEDRNWKRPGRYPTHAASTDQASCQAEATKLGTWKVEARARSVQPTIQAPAGPWFAELGTMDSGSQVGTLPTGTYRLGSSPAKAAELAL